MNDGSYQGGAYGYWLGGDIYGAKNTHAWIFSSMYGHVENGNFYLKHQDFSKESMEPTYNWWVLALYGDIVSEATFDSLNHVEDTYINDPNVPLVGGTQVENPNDFYMAFKVSEVLKDSSGYSEGQSWYGWVHVSIDENLEMTLLEDGINLTGGAVTVGVTPEPSSALLLLVGGALLALRRGGTVGNVAELGIGTQPCDMNGSGRACRGHLVGSPRRGDRPSRPARRAGPTTTGKMPVGPVGRDKRGRSRRFIGPRQARPLPF